MKIAVLYDIWEEEGATAEPPPEPKPATRKSKARKKKKREKEDREEIFEALEKLGHEPSYLILDGSPQGLTSLAKCEADLIFNLTESFAGDDTKRDARRRLPRSSWLALYRCGAAREFSCARQGDCEKDVRVSRHPNSIFRDFLSRHD